MTKARNLADIGSYDKLATTSTGIDVTGTVTADDLSVAVTGSTAAYLGGINLGANGTDIVGTISGLALKTDTKTLANFDANNNLHLYEDTGTTAKFFWDASAESLGIGTSSPSGVLHLSATNPDLYITSADTGQSDILMGGTSDPDAGIIRYADNDDSMRIFTNNAERMRIDSSGNVGIGVSSPSLSFEVGQNTAKGYMHSGIGVFSVGTSTNHPYGFDVNGSERMRIDSNGDLYIGKTSNSTTTNGIILSSGGGTDPYFYVTSTRTDGGGVPFNINRQGSTGVAAIFKYAGSTKGSITIDSSSTAYNTSSDYRLKEDWKPMTGATDRLLQLNPVNFAWKVDGSRVDGFLAHELAEVIPEAVTGEKDAVDAEGNPDYQGIDQSKLVPLLTAALQEALTRIETLEAKVAVLETN